MLCFACAVVSLTLEHICSVAVIAIFCSEIDLMEMR